MAHDNELRLISRAITDRDITPLVDRGVQADWFRDNEVRALWTFTHHHWQTYGEVPSRTTVRDNYPTATLLRVHDSIEYLLDQLVAYRRLGQTTELVQQAGALLEDQQAGAAIDVLTRGLAGLQDLATAVPHDIDLADADYVERQLAAYKALRGSKGMLGIPTGFPTIDAATAGLQAGQLVTVVATPKAGKSTLALRCAINVFLEKHSSMFISFEMSNSEQQDRYFAMLTHISHTRLTRGQLKPSEWDRLVDRTKRLFPLERGVVLVEATNTVSGVAAKIEKYKPEVVFIDGVYLMTDEISGEQNTPLALTNITRNLKRLAQRCRIPIVISTQALTWKVSRRSGVTGDSIGYSSSFFQDSDVILGLDHVVDDDMKRKLKVVASRNCGRVEVEMLWDWENGRHEEIDFDSPDARHREPPPDEEDYDAAFRDAG